MPELPEVETVRRGLAPYLTGARIAAVTLNRADLRFAFPPELKKRLEGETVAAVGRRAKYLLFSLAGGGMVLSHLGMTGSYRFTHLGFAEPTRYHPVPGGHDHMIWSLVHPEHGAFDLVYADPRRFGFVDYYEDAAQSPYLAGLGPEPLSNAFDAPYLATRVAGRKAPVKTALLDQRIVAGLGNIYVCEALYRAHILPTVAAGDLVAPDGRPKPALEDLVAAIRAVLVEAIAAGGSTLRDFRAADGELGYFQHSFSVYDREGEPCLTPGCAGTVARLVQSGRSTFYCPVCQKPAAHKRPDSS